MAADQVPGGLPPPPPGLLGVQMEGDKNRLKIFNFESWVLIRSMVGAQYSLELVECQLPKKLWTLPQTTLKSLVFSACSLPIVSTQGGITSILPSSLRWLKIEACYWNPNSNINPLASLPLGHLKYLESLSITNCPNIGSLPGLQWLNHLKQLTLMGCPKLAHAETKLEMLGMLRSPLLRDFTTDAPSLLYVLAEEALASLQYLHIKEFKEESFRWEELEQVFQHLTSLKHLLFADCSIRSLPNNLKDLSSLEGLSIKSCPNITSLPDLLPLLRKSFSDLDLRGRNHPELEKQGEYWRERMRSPYFRSCRASHSSTESSSIRRKEAGVF